MTTDSYPTGTLRDDALLSADELALACGVSIEWVSHHLEEGALVCIHASGEPLFTTRALVRARRIRSLERDFDAEPELAALVADMLDELDDMRAQLRRLGFD